MTTTRQHIADLDPTTWARMTLRAAQESVEASRRVGLRPRPETLALAAMTEAELIEHRERNGPAKTRLSPVMQLVEADQRSREARSRERHAHQGRLDAEAAASMAKADADESARVATQARERVRAVEAESDEKDRRRAREHAADREAVQAVRAEIQQVRSATAAEIEQVRADAAAEVAAAHERARAAEERAEQRASERTAERAAAETLVQELRDQLERVRADAAAEVAAARERAAAADARAEQRLAERVQERAAAEEAAGRLRAEVEQIRANAAAEVAAARHAASGEVAAVRERAAAEIQEAQLGAQVEVDAAQAQITDARLAAQAEISDARRAAQADIDRAHAYADDVVHQAQDEVARVTSAVRASEPLMIPVASVTVRPQIGSLESVLDALYRIGYLLENSMVGSSPPPDVEYVRSLTRSVQERAKVLSSELAELPGRFIEPSDVEASSSYANAAGVAYSGLLQRIEDAAWQLMGRNEGPDEQIVAAVSAMVRDPWVQGLRQ